MAPLGATSETHERKVFLNSNIAQCYTATAWSICGTKEWILIFTFWWSFASKTTNFVNFWLIFKIELAKKVIFMLKMALCHLEISPLFIQVPQIKDTNRKIRTTFFIYIYGFNYGSEKCAFKNVQMFFSCFLLISNARWRTSALLSIIFVVISTTKRFQMACFLGVTTRVRWKLSKS